MPSLPPRLCRRGILAAAVASGASACSPLAVFDALAPRDDGGQRAASSLAYGPHPRQSLDVYVPTDRNASGRAPVAVFFYGGSWKGGRKEEYAFVGAALSARGFLAVLPDYRVYPEVRFPDFLDDGAAAVRVAQLQAERFGGDGRRIVLIGHSAGAYNAAMLALDPSYLGRAGVPRASVKALAGLSGPYDFTPLDPGTAREVFGAAPDIRRTQPVTFVDRGSPPAFLATGDEDDTVRPKNTASLAARLRSQGVPVVERTYPGLDHKDTLIALSVPFRNRAPILDDMTAFLSARIGSA